MPREDQQQRGREQERGAQVVVVRDHAAEVRGLQHEHREHRRRSRGAARRPSTDPTGAGSGQLGAGIGCGRGRRDIAADRLRDAPVASGRGVAAATTVRAATMVHRHGGGAMRVRTDDGVELAVEVEGSGPGLLLVHGHGGAKEDFADHVERLARTTPS